MTENIDIYLTLNQVTQRFGVSHTTIYRWMELQRFPKKIRLGANTIRWKKSDIDAWEAHQEKAS